MFEIDQQERVMKTAPEAIHKIHVLATTDLHCNALNYDYYRDRALDQFGLAKIATLLGEIRNESNTVFLFDNGDLIQGTPLAETRVMRFKIGDYSGHHPMIRLMNHLAYDAATVGNHEFNFGLEYLRWVMSGAAFSYVNSNILNVSELDGLQTFLPPYAILERKIDGIPFRLGVVGFVPPQIMQWDRIHLQGQVKVLDIQVAAKMFVPQLKARKVDAIVALSHSGLVFGTPGAVNENSSFALSRIADIDVIVAGHTHDVFPSADFEHLNQLGVSLEQGTINSKAVVMPGFWGSHLGVAELEVQRQDNAWKILARNAKVLSTRGIAADPAVEQLVHVEHVQTQVRMRSAVGSTLGRLHTYFARIMPSEAVQLTNQAHIWYAERMLAQTEWSELPILAVSAPFRAGFAGYRDFTDIHPGEIAMQHIADLYVYPNSFACVLVDGQLIRQWLERSAENFNQINRESTETQWLVNKDFPSYNFDTFLGISYVFDVEQEVGKRVKGLCFRGVEIDPSMQFVVATNSYRANGGGKFPGLDGSSIIYEAPEVSAEVLLEYIRFCCQVKVELELNWSILPFQAKGPVYFESPQNSRGLAPAWLVCENLQEKGVELRYKVEF